MVDTVGFTNKLFPVPIRVPPQEALYHLITVLVPPPPPVKVKVELPPTQIDVGEHEAEVGLLDF